MFIYSSVNLTNTHTINVNKSQTNTFLNFPTEHQTAIIRNVKLYYVQTGRNVILFVFTPTPEAFGKCFFAKSTRARLVLSELAYSTKTTPLFYT